MIDFTNKAITTKSDLESEQLLKKAVAQPIDVASMLINATITVEPDNFGPLSPLRNKGSQTFAKYDTNQLQEIADHLLTYCKAQERGFKDACCENCKSESV